MSQINETLTHFAAPSARCAPDQINRDWGGEQITPHLVWENLASQVVQTPSGSLGFAEPVRDKQHAFALALGRRHDRGKAHGVIQGIGVVTGLDVQPKLAAFWRLDDRIYEPDGDGNRKLGQVQAMLSHAV